MNTFFVDKSKKVEKNKEFITFKENPNFEIRYGKQVNAQIKIFIEKHNKDYDIEIKALKTFDTTQYIEILDEENLPVGIIGMSPNQVEVLEVKIVPVIISHFITEESKADLLRKANELYASINKNEIIKKLNNHSLNQAGIQCKLMTDHKNIEYISVRTHDYYKNYWDNTNSKLKDFTLTTEQEKNDFYREVPKDEDGDTNRGVTKDLLLDKLERDYFKKYGNSFKGAIIFVTESEYIDENGKEDTGGYSQVIPIKNQGTIIFGNNIKNSYTYAHELGHMLGLQHTFIKDEKELNDLNETIKNYIQNENKIIVSIEQNKETIKDYENRIMERNKEIEELKISIGKSKEKKQLTKEEMYDIKENERFIVEKEKNIIEYQNEINYYSEQINILNNKIKFQSSKISLQIGEKIRLQKGKTLNLMDYNNHTGYLLNKQQIEIIKEDINNYK